MDADHCSMGCDATMNQNLQEDRITATRRFTKAENTLLTEQPVIHLRT